MTTYPRLLRRMGTPADVPSQAATGAHRCHARAPLTDILLVLKSLASVYCLMDNSLAVDVLARLHLQATFAAQNTSIIVPAPYSKQAVFWPICLWSSW